MQQVDLENLYRQALIALCLDKGEIEITLPAEQYNLMYKVTPCEADKTLKVQFKICPLRALE